MSELETALKRKHLISSELAKYCDQVMKLQFMIKHIEDENKRLREENELFNDKEGRGLSDPRWKKPLTQEEMKHCLGIACCALDKIAEWSDDDDRFGDPGLFAKTTLDNIYAGGGCIIDKSTQIECSLCGREGASAYVKLTTGRMACSTCADALTI